MYCVVSHAVSTLTTALLDDKIYGSKSAPDFITDFSSYYSLFNKDHLGLLGLQLLPGNCYDQLSALLLLKATMYLGMIRLACINTNSDPPPLYPTSE